MNIIENQFNKSWGSAAWAEPLNQLLYVFIYSALRNKRPRHNKSPRSQPAISLVGIASNRPFHGFEKHQCSISRVGTTPMLHFAGWNNTNATFRGLEKHQCSISLVGDSANADTTADSYYAFQRNLLGCCGHLARTYSTYGICNVCCKWI